MMRLTRRWKWASRATAVVSLCIATAIGWNFATGNFATVLPGLVYRSAQLRSGDLARKLAENGVRTVLNLRGHHPESAWYRGERDETLAAGATQVDIAMSSRDWMSRVQLRALVDVLEAAEKPILIHCWQGSERTGLASAFATLLREGSTLAEARAQFSARYLFFPFGGGVVTLHHLDQYESWLKKQGALHSPGTFRKWVGYGYVPGHPGREDWPADPFPLVVMTRPTPEGPVEHRIEDHKGKASLKTTRQDADPILAR
jgi:protein tyrosine phosphatase (PTP) superfamily phosphohydrolase (DUF442 family)